MSRHQVKKICVQDALEFVLNGNDSDVDELSSDEEEDDPDFVLAEEDDEESVERNARNGENDPGHDVEQGNLDGAANNMPHQGKKAHTFRWRQRDVPTPNDAFHMEREEIIEPKTPLEYFKMFWTDELTELVAEQTNLYSTQRSGRSIKTTKNEIEQLLGMQMKMGIIQLPSYLLYWSQNLRYAPIADVMPLKRYQKLRQYLHFVGNMTYDDRVHDKLFKIKPVLESVREQCIKIQPEQSHSVDEQIIPAKTRFSKIRQYNPNKPEKWGSKNLVRAGTTGFMYDFYIYGGKEAETDDTAKYQNLQKSAKVVARLCQELPAHANHQLFFDNWFTTLDLLLYLKQKGILACGTIRANRLKGCPLKENKEMKAEGRGALDFMCDMNSGIVVAKWFDNNAVHIASNFVGVHPVGSVERWCSDQKARKEINCPQIIICYNKGMGGVDLADMLIALYRIAVKTKRWYLKIFWHCVNIAKVNAWLLYRRHCDELGIAKKNQMSLLSLFLAIAEALILANKSALTPGGRQGRPPKRKSIDADPAATKAGRKPLTPNPSSDARLDQFDRSP